ncbi:carotenoid cleavage dioxygenase [Sphingomonas sp. PP-CE-1A-559]|uniref:8'-apo-carotenoid 13,14-cleaving dioxygenase n=1 Tax=Sphingomonas sp. PP-CE-1A-559 TaxID=2135657 RepID=UPI0010551B36|nr:carotenoid oxygenase family protein [Sphingomonas sp. PP-CE-1A-559]TCP82171.1 carotenoid cleavage dioxygenase [Sphingomonas sp. PP-CE-1A-559]
MASVLAQIDDGNGEGPRTGHPFLSGIHRPMAEELTLTELAVRGTIPPALQGRYLRTGPNPVAADPASYHWFTGDGMVHGLAIRDGKALWYRNRWIGSRSNAAARGTTPALGPRHGSSDTVNTNVIDLAGRVFAVVEGGSYPVALSDTLDEQRYDDFAGSLVGSFTAHPHRDPLTGEYHGICYEGRRLDEIRHVVLDATGKVVREAPIAVEHGPMIHDCAVTARYVVILDLPVTFSLATHLAGQPLPYAWNPVHRARVGLMPRDGDQHAIIWCDVDPAYVFHVANAFDLPDGRVVLDVCAYPTMFAGVPGGPDVASRGLERWTLDPATGTTAIRTIDATPQEFPRVDERRFGQAYRYAYAMGTQSDRRFQSASRLYKHDLVAGGRQVHDFGPGRHPGEFVFVPAHDTADEDEGWLMGFVIDAPNDTTELVILDASRFEHAPVATIRLPHRIPPGFHGNWINGGEAQ